MRILQVKKSDFFFLEIVFVLLYKIILAIKYVNPVALPRFKIFKWSSN